MKARFVIVVLFVFAVAVPVQMLAQQNSIAEKEVRAVLDELTQANLKGGAEAATIIDKYLADDMVRIPSNGSSFTKSDMLDGFKTGKIKAEKMELSDVKIHMYGNTAVVTGVMSVQSTVIDASYNNKNRFTRVFVKRGGTWQCVLYQNTPIAEPANAQASNNAPPSYVADPAVYKVIDENDQFLVISAKRPVGHRDAWHSHLALTWYNLTDCPSRVYTPDGKTVEFIAKANSHGLMSAVPSHALENIGTAECGQIIVEHK